MEIRSSRLTPVFSNRRAMYTTRRRLRSMRVWRALLVPLLQAGDDLGLLLPGEGGGQSAAPPDVHDLAWLHQAQPGEQGAARSPGPSRIVSWLSLPFHLNRPPGEPGSLPRRTPGWGERAASMGPRSSSPTCTWSTRTASSSRPVHPHRAVGEQAEPPPPGVLQPLQRTRRVPKVGRAGPDSGGQELLHAVRLGHQHRPPRGRVGEGCFPYPGGEEKPAAPLE